VEWERLAQDTIGFNPESPTHPKDIAELNRRITAAYAAMYLTNPVKFSWAGMAAVVSCDIGKRMRQARAMREEAGSLFVAAGSLITNAPTGTELGRALGKGNLGVYADIYWQHLAYSQAGIAEMRNLKARGELPAQQLNAWELIDAGNESEGNRQLLLYEQRVLLPRAVYDPHAAAFQKLSEIAHYAPDFAGLLDSPIPGGSSFSRCVPGGNLGAFDDRWRWIETSLLPAWQRLNQDSPKQVHQMMNDYLKGQYKRHP
jgi:hypothetical protein